ncbi:hypothetical protein EBT25_00450 [bacterium]|nr:hypothetical protein [bacterium]
MGRYLTTLPENFGYFNLGTVEAYPTGGSGPTAYGPTSYFGSDPQTARPGDNFNNAINLGNFDTLFRSITLSNTHGGNTRIQSTFYTFDLTKARSIQFVQNFSQFAYTSNTNRNTILSCYIIEDGTHRRELPINNDGFICNQASINYDEGDDTPTEDYPTTQLKPGSYMILITNDIRYLETTYSITMQSSLTDWRFITEGLTASFDFDGVSTGVDSTIDYGTVR